MSKMSELDLTVKELRMAAQSLIAVAEGLSALFSGSAEPVLTGEPPAPPKEVSKPMPQTVTTADVRTVLTKKAAEGFGEQVRALLAKYGVQKVSEVPPEKCAELKAEAEGIGNER